MAAAELMLVRHGESMGNLAAAQAHRDGAEVIEVDRRDADVELSPLGREQAIALGSWLADLPADEKPTAVWSSTYRRAVDTAAIALAQAGIDLPVRLDERLRDRELGILDRLTNAGVLARYPEEAARRAWLGKFYHRPPGGESWADMALRVRSVLAEIDRCEDGGRVLIAGHDALILVVRYVCEAMTEQQILDLGAATAVRNASVTRLVPAAAPGGWRVTDFNEADHLAAEGVAVTEHGSDTDVRPPQE